MGRFGSLSDWWLMILSPIRCRSRLCQLVRSSHLCLEYFVLVNMQSQVAWSSFSTQVSNELPSWKKPSNKNWDPKFQQDNFVETHHFFATSVLFGWYTLVNQLCFDLSILELVNQRGPKSLKNISMMYVLVVVVSNKFFLFTPAWGDDPNWKKIFCRWVETTN